MSTRSSRLPLWGSARSRRRADLRMASWRARSLKANVVPYALLVTLLVAALLLNIGIGSVSVSPGQILSIVGAHLAHLVSSVGASAERSMPDGVWRDQVWLAPLAPLAEWIGAHAQGLQHWIRSDVSRQEDAVVWAIRIPRTLLGAVIGAGLAVSGAAMQGVFRNPLADPGLIGVSSGAALGAVTAIVLDVTVFGLWTLPVFAFGFGLAVTFAVYLLARHQGTTEVVTLLLASVAFNAVAGAATGLLIATADDQELRSVTFWTLGSLAGSQWTHVGIVGSVTGIGLMIVLRYRSALNLFALGEREARHLGVRVEAVRVVLIFTTAAMTGTAVAFAGAIGFVGLVVPHLIRLWLGPDHHRLLPLSAIAGATLLLLADLSSRTLAAPTEFPIGVTMSIVGGPFFIWLILRTRRQQGGWA